MGMVWLIFYTDYEYFLRQKKINFYIAVDRKTTKKICYVSKVSCDFMFNLFNVMYDNQFFCDVSNKIIIKKLQESINELWMWSLCCYLIETLKINIKMINY